MKQLTLILVVLFIGCKSGMNTVSGIDNSVNEIWENYTQANPEFANDEIPDADSFHNNKEDADRLAELILIGKKTAGSSLYSLYEKYNADLPKVGTKQIVTNFDGKALAIIETTKVDTIPFNKISSTYAAMDMGTEIDALKKWKKAHWEFFEGFTEDGDIKLTEDMLIVCMRFETIWPEKH